ncbi:unnamed protein product [Cochlearia groenlandica]
MRVLGCRNAKGVAMAVENAKVASVSSLLIFGIVFPIVEMDGTYGSLCEYITLLPEKKRDVDACPSPSSSDRTSSCPQPLQSSIAFLLLLLLSVEY